MSGQFNNPAKSAPDVNRIKQEKRAQRKAAKKQKRMKWYSVMVVILHAFLSVFFLWMFFSLNILPANHSLVVFAVVILLLIVTVLTQKGKKGARIAGRIYAVLVMLVLLGGGLILGAGNYVLEQVTGAPLEKKQQEFDLLSGGGISSITEDVFGIYVKEMSRDNSEAEVFYVVNPQKRQALSVVTPSQYYLAISDVTNGRKDWLGTAWDYSPEAALETLGTLYETHITHYLHMDSPWVAEMKELLGHNLQVKQIGQLIKEIPQVKKHLQTSLSKYEVQQLIKAEIKDRSEWRMHTETATGRYESSYTFSSPDERVSVILPDTESVEKIAEMIDRVEDDELLEDNTSKEPGENPVVIIP